MARASGSGCVGGCLQPSAAARIASKATPVVAETAPQRAPSKRAPSRPKQPAAAALAPAARPACKRGVGAVEGASDTAAVQEGQPAGAKYRCRAAAGAAAVGAAAAGQRRRGPTAGHSTG